MTSTSTSFSNARNLQFNGNNNFVGRDVIYNEVQSTDKRGIDLLQSHCALEALIDANERFDAPRCSPETRNGIIDEITAWINNSSSGASMMWLTGAAGAGKSALAQTIAQRLKQEGRLLGSFFFNRSSSTRSNGNLLIPTLALQLTQELPETYSYLSEYIKKNPGIFSKNRGVQMDELFKKPLERFSFRRTVSNFLNSNPSRLIVVDGLDECQHHDIQCDLLKIIASTVGELKKPLRFLISSRPEPQLRRTFDHDPNFERVSLRRMDLDKDPGAQADIRRFLIQEFQTIRRTHRLGPYIAPSWPPESAITKIISKSSPQFIYASTVIKYIASVQHSPEDRLVAIVDLMDNRQESFSGNIEKPLSALRPLDVLYSFIFSSVPEETRDLVWRVLGILWVEARVKKSSILEAVLELQIGRVHLLLDPLSSVISCPPGRDTPIAVLHASLFDYLLEPARSGIFSLDLQYAYESLAIFFHTYSHPGGGPLAGNPELEDFYPEPRHFHLFLDYSREAYLSEKLQKALSLSHFSVIVQEFEEIIIDGPRVFEWMIHVVDCMTDICLRKEFVDGKRVLYLFLSDLNDYLRRKSALMKMVPYWESNTPGLPQFKEGSYIPTATREIYLAVLNYKWTVFGPDNDDPPPERVNEIPGRVWKYEKAKPINRGLQHLLVILLHGRKGDSWIQGIIDSSTSSLIYFPSTSYNPEVDAELNEMCDKLLEHRERSDDS